jgi:5-methylcytosine-specific restriction protein A
MVRKISRAAMAQRLGMGRRVKAVPLEATTKKTGHNPSLGYPPSLGQTRPAWGNCTPKASARAPRWQDRASRKAQAEQLRREPYCRRCAEAGKTVEATEVDHIIPRSEGGSLTDPANLMSLCWDHHQDKSAQDRSRRTGRPVRRRRKVKIDPATGYPLPGQEDIHWWSEPLPEKAK